MTNLRHSKRSELPDNFGKLRDLYIRKITEKAPEKEIRQVKNKLNKIAKGIDLAANVFSR